MKQHYGYIKTVEDNIFQKDQFFLSITSLSSGEKYVVKANSTAMGNKEIKKGTLIVFLVFGSTVLDEEPIKPIQKERYYK